MKQIITIILIIIIIISLIVAAFTINQVQREQERLNIDLQYRSTILAESLKEIIEPDFINKSDLQLQRLVDKSNDQQRFAGLAVFNNKGSSIATSSGFMVQSPQVQKIVSDAMDADKANGDFIQIMEKKMYALAIPLHDQTNIIGALIIAQHASYIDDRLNEIWRNNLLRLILQASLLSTATILLVRWIIYKPIKTLTDSLKLARAGKLDGNDQKQSNSVFLKPLAKEISNIQRSLIEARMSATQEAKLRLEKLDTPWTAHRLRVFVKDILKKRTIYMVSSREPYIHTKEGRNISYYVPASGMVTAIEPIMEACGGVWIAHGSGNADKLTVDQNDKLQAPPDEPKYTLKRVWLTDQEEAGYYNGFCNEGLWPLCHLAHTRPAFRKEDWEEYKKVNEKFAQTILFEIKDQERPIVLVQDFHLALVPGIVKNTRPDATVGIFWHIPWPNSESFSICPWKKEILGGMLGADLLGFQTQLHCNNFIETVSRELESLIDFEQFTITRHGHTSYVKPFPISIAFPEPSSKKDHKFDAKGFLKSINVKTKYIGLGVDRLDYTKGILERLKAVEIFLQNNPVYIGNFTFIQIAAPSRGGATEYQRFAKEVEKEVVRINNLFKRNGWKPVILLKRYHSQEEIYRFYKAASLCMVTSLHDGMNLVAKEFIAARNDEKGVLILSQYTGASRELKDALIVNPYNGEQTAQMIKTALEMTDEEQSRRMKQMREIVENNNVYRWSAEFLKTLAGLGL